MLPSGSMVKRTIIMGTARHTTVRIALVALGITLAGSVRAAEPQDCTLKQYGSIDLIVTDGAVLMSIQINGKPAVMALNFGSAAGRAMPGELQAISDDLVRGE
jgi:hypothetical protein